MIVGVVDDESFDAHRAMGAHPERPARLAAAREGLARSLPEDRREVIEAREATAEEIARVHSAAHVQSLDTALQRGFGLIDADTFYSPGTRRAAWRAAGAAAELATRLMTTDLKRAMALLRPPGHHAEPERAMGFCLLNNIAIAAEAALAAGADRVAIIDWDVHHGNGTQHHFEARDDVSFVSLHQYPLYPGTGAATETGTGQGSGATANVALPSGSGDAAVGAAFRKVVLPLVRAHAPDLILVSAGFDGHKRDRISGLELSTESYGAMASALVTLAEELGHGRVGFILEGGYELVSLSDSVSATLDAAQGTFTDLPEDAPPERVRSAIELTAESLRRRS